MQITAAALVALLPFLTAAAPAAEPASSSTAASPNYFYGMSARSASPIHLRSIDANGLAFYIGKPTTSYCPEGIEGCPTPGNSTVFVTGDGTLSLGVLVPGGQQVYVAKNGALGFTQAHSGAVPAGSTRTGFTFTPGESFGTLNWGKGFVACPTKADKNVYQVYGTSKTIKAPSKDCLGFDFLAPKADNTGAWEYV